MQMFFQTRKKLAKLEKLLARQSAIIEGLTARISSQSQQSGPDLGAIIGSMLETQGKQFTSAGEFLRTINEIALERAGRSMGRTGGRARAAKAQRDKRGRLLPAAARTDCPLCNDPMTANFSMAEWGAHQSHRGLPVKRRYPEDNDDGRTIEIQRTEPTPSYPLPAVDFPSGDEAGRPGGPPPAGEDIDHGDHIHKADGTVVRKADVSERN